MSLDLTVSILVLAVIGLILLAEAVIERWSDGREISKMDEEEKSL